MVLGVVQRMLKKETDTAMPVANNDASGPGGRTCRLGQIGERSSLTFELHPDDFSLF
jgi:hypothetical protein